MRTASCWRAIFVFWPYSFFTPSLFRQSTAASNQQDVKCFLPFLISTWMQTMMNHSYHGPCRCSTSGGGAEGGGSHIPLKEMPSSMLEISLLTLKGNISKLCMVCVGLTMANPMALPSFPWTPKMQSLLSQTLMVPNGIIGSLMYVRLWHKRKDGKNG